MTDWIQLIRAEHLEISGLHLTKPQVQPGFCVAHTEGRVTGMITDRDICIALATRGRSADRVYQRSKLLKKLQAVFGTPIGRRHDSLIPSRGFAVTWYHYDTSQTLEVGFQWRTF